MNNRSAVLQISDSAAKLADAVSDTLSKAPDKTPAQSALVTAVAAMQEALRDALTEAHAAKVIYENNGSLGSDILFVDKAEILTVTVTNGRFSVAGKQSASFDLPRTEVTSLRDALDALLAYTTTDLIAPVRVPLFVPDPSTIAIDGVSTLGTETGTTFLTATPGPTPIIPTLTHATLIDKDDHAIMLMDPSA